MSGIIDAEARAQIEELVARYAHAIDNDLIEDWPLFFIDDGQYLVTTRENLAKGRPIGIMYCDGRGMMQDRVTALRQAIVFEPHVYRHIVGSTLISAAEDGSYAAASNFHILRTGADGAVVIHLWLRPLSRRDRLASRSDAISQAHSRARFLAHRHPARDPIVISCRGRLYSSTA